MQIARIYVTTNSKQYYGRGVKKLRNIKRKAKVEQMAQSWLLNPLFPFCFIIRPHHKAHLLPFFIKSLIERNHHENNDEGEGERRNN